MNKPRTIHVPDDSWLRWRKHALDRGVSVSSLIFGAMEAITQGLTGKVIHRGSFERGDIVRPFTQYGPEDDDGS